MGGYGSTRWGGRYTRRTVEDCRILPMTADLVKLIGLGPKSSAEVTWSTNGERQAAIMISREDEDGLPFLRFRYTVTRGGASKEISYLVGVEFALTPRGGKKWYFRCPAYGQGCRRRCSKLYLPYGGDVFACRDCHKLTYTSCQESGKYNAVFARLAHEMGDGFTARDVARILRRTK